MQQTIDFQSRCSGELIDHRQNREHRHPSSRHSVITIAVEVAAVRLPSFAKYYGMRAVFEKQGTNDKRGIDIHNRIRAPTLFSPDACTEALRKLTRFLISAICSGFPGGSLL